MRKLKQFIIIILSIIILSKIVYVIKAEENIEESINIESMTLKEVNDEFYNITDSIINKNTNKLNKSMFENDALNNIINYVYNNNIGGEINNTAIDFTYPNNSSTGDTIVMVNAKVSYKEGYNKLYLFEYHVNKNGKIYGYNIWVY